MKKVTAFLAAVAMMASLTGGALSVQAADKTDLTIAEDVDVETLHSTDYSTTVEHDILSQIYDPLILVPGVTIRITSLFTRPLASFGSSTCSQIATLCPLLTRRLRYPSTA